MSRPEVYLQDLFCPSCGNFVTDIDDETGFCFECIGSRKARCLGCDRLFTKDQSHRKLCHKCREERWLERNADRIEIYMEAGATFTFAKREVYYENRPVCISCGKTLNMTAGGANFCKSNLECRRWRERYKRVKRQLQFRQVLNPDKQALAQVSAEIFATHHRMEL